MPRRIPCAHPGCGNKIDAGRGSVYCRHHFNAAQKRAAQPRPEPRWPVRVVDVPLATNIGADGYRYAPVTVRKEPWV